MEQKLKTTEKQHNKLTTKQPTDATDATWMQHTRGWDQNSYHRTSDRLTETDTKGVCQEIAITKVNTVEWETEDNGFSKMLKYKRKISKSVTQQELRCNRNWKRNCRTSVYIKKLRKNKGLTESKQSTTSVNRFHRNWIHWQKNIHSVSVEKKRKLLQRLQVTVFCINTDTSSDTRHLQMQSYVSGVRLTGDQKTCY